MLPMPLIFPYQAKIGIIFILKGLKEASLVSSSSKDVIQVNFGLFCSIFCRVYDFRRIGRDCVVWRRLDVFMVYLLEVVFDFVFIYKTVILVVNESSSVKYDSIILKFCKYFGHSSNHI